MIQEHKDLLHIHKDLLLKDLSARLPYKVKVEIKNVCKICTLEEIDCSDEEMSVAVKHENGELAGYDFDLAKPYLFPLESMTEEQEKEFALLQTSLGNEGFLYVWNCVNMMKWLIENNFDYNGFIPRGLANDATSKDIYKLVK